MPWEEVISTTWGALQGSIEVLLIMSYGYGTRLGGLLSHNGERNLSTLVTKVSLPALLFTAIGPSATASTIVEYWTIIVYSVLYQLICFLYGLVCLRLGIFDSGMWIGACIFNNVISLPLLMLESLSGSGALDRIGNTDGAVNRARTYLLVNALVSQLASFIFGPQLMSPKTPSRLDSTPPSGPVTEFRTASDDLEHVHEETRLLPGPSELDYRPVHNLWSKLMTFMNPPLLGGLLAVVIGIIPPLHSILFDSGGLLRGSLTESIEQVGKLYTPLQMLVVGAQLYTASRVIRHEPVHVSKISMIALFMLRFVLMPMLSIFSIYYLRIWQPDLFPKDPMYDFALMIASVGPPAIHLAAIAELASFSDLEKGVLSKILMLSYMVTPFISLSIAASLAVVEKEGIVHQALVQ